MHNLCGVCVCVFIRIQNLEQREQYTLYLLELGDFIYGLWISTIIYIISLVFQVEWCV